jgi:hypothetical protein
MARDAASGSVRIRGGANHQGVEFAARSTFMFSAINPPPLPPASLSRLAMIQMRPIKTTDAPAPVLEAAETIGPRLLRRLADGWKTEFPRLFAAYKTALRENGHDQRGQDTFGTFLAGRPHPARRRRHGGARLEVQNLNQWGSRLAADAAPETANQQANWARCVEQIMTAQVDAWNKGERHQVGQLLEEFLARRISRLDGQHRLAPADLALLPPKPALGREGHVLIVPHSGRGIAALLRDTSYAGARGSEGSWSTALHQGPENIILRAVTLRGGSDPTNRVSVAGTQRRATFIDLAELKKWQETQG